MNKVLAITYSVGIMGTIESKHQQGNEMIKSYNSEKEYSAVKAAKCLILQYGESASYWQEKGVIDMEALSKKEEQEICDAISNQYNRVQRFLRINSADYL